MGGHSLANNLISHVLLNRDDKNVRAVGFNGLPHRAFNETHHTDGRYKHYHSRYDPVSYDPAANEKQTPLRRNVTIEEVGNAGAFLCSDLASGISGEILYVDGGFNTTAMGSLED